MERRLTRRLTWVALAALIVGLFGLAIPAWLDQFQRELTLDQRLALPALGLDPLGLAGRLVALRGVFALVHLGVGAILIWRRSSDRMAWIAALTLALFGGATFPDTLSVLAAAYPAWRIPAQLVALLGDTSLVVLLYLFPDGRFVPRWTRWLVMLWVLGRAPYRLLPEPPAVPTAASALLFVSAPALAIAVQVYRYRRVSSAIQRQQTKWVVFGIGGALGVFLTLVLFDQLALVQGGPAWLDLLGEVVQYAAMLLIPLSIGVAVLRARLWDIDPLIQRTLVYGALSLGIIVAYVGVVGYLSALFRSADNVLISLIATSVVAVLFQPLRARVQRAVNRMLYGQRDEPYAVLSGLAARLESSLAPEAVLPTIAETTARALRLPYAAVSVQRGETVNYGQPTATTVRLPLSYQAQAVGELILAPRGAGETFSSADLRLLEDIARQAGVAAHAVQLTADLRTSLQELRLSREQLVLAQEEERRRIQRDLHDGLGPTLASMRLRVEACLELAQASPVDDLVSELERLDALIGHATGDIRRLVHGLRPPALEQLGLAGALRQHVERFELDSGVAARLDLVPDISLPAAAEVAAFRVAQEALVNVHKHAHARQVDIRLRQNGTWLELSVCDDGIGLPPDALTSGRGAGLRGMRERAELLGGELALHRRPTGGSSVRLRIPLREVIGAAHV